MPAPLTAHHKAILKALRDGTQFPKRTASLGRLGTLRRLGLIDRERTAAGDTWALTPAGRKAAGAKPKPRPAKPKR